MDTNSLNSLHLEYKHRFQAEFQELLAQQTFAEAVFRNSDLLFKYEDASFYNTLRHCFGCSFEGMALGLSRIWDERSGDKNLISIPNLVTIFADYSFLGCQGLAPGKQDRSEYDALYADPIRTRLRVVRTEALAHNVMVGTSRDRKKSDLEDKQDFGVVNGDALSYCRKTIGLLFSLNDQLSISDWREKKSMAEMTSEWNDHHIAFLKNFVAQVQ